MSPHLPGWLRRSRKAKVLTLVQVAVATNTSTSFVSKVERGLRQLPLDRVADFAKVLGVAAPNLADHAAEGMTQITLSLEDVSYRKRSLAVLLGWFWRRVTDHEAMQIFEILRVRGMARVPQEQDPKEELRSEIEELMARLASAVNRLVSLQEDGEEKPLRGDFDPDEKEVQNSRISASTAPSAVRFL